MRAPSFKGLREDKSPREVVWRRDPTAVDAPRRTRREALFDEVERLPDGSLAVLVDGRRAEDLQLGQGPLPADRLHQG